NRSNFAVKHTVYIGLGSNLGEREANILEALKRIEKAGCVVEVVSSMLENPAAYMTEQTDFANACARLKSSMAPSDVLDRLLQIESEMGRVRSIQNGPRIIDLDILLFDDLIIDEDGLTIPHPGILERHFVLLPLHEIAPDLIHPITQRQLPTV